MVKEKRSVPSLRHRLTQNKLLLKVGKTQSLNNVLEISAIFFTMFYNFEMTRNNLFQSIYFRYSTSDIITINTWSKQKFFKVRKSWKKSMLSWILPKNQRRGNFMYWKLLQRSFFGRIQDAIICFCYLLTFRISSEIADIFKVN